MRLPPISIFVVAIAAFFLRIIRLEQLYYFNMDEALLAFRGWGLFALKRIFIIGGISPLGFHLPPYFYWLSAVFLRLSNFDPQGWGYFGAFIGIATLILLYYLTNKIIDRKTALITSLLYATSFTVVFFDRHYWPLSFNPLLTVSVLFLLLSNFKYKWEALAIALVFGITADPSNVPIFFVVAYYLFANKIELKRLLPGIVIFIVLFVSPLIVFDIRHSGSNISGVQRFFTASQSTQNKFLSTGNSVLLIPRFLSQFWYSPQTNISLFHTYCPTFSSQRQEGQPVILQLAAGLLILIFIIKKIKGEYKADATIAAAFLIYAVGLFVYGGILGRPLFDHYLAALLPLCAYLTARALVRFWVIGFFILVILVSTNLSQIIKAVNPYGLQINNEAVSWVNMNLNGNEYALDVHSNCFRYNGLRYLFEISGTPPSISYIDPQFFWLYKDKPKDYFPNRVVLFTDEKALIGEPVINRQQFGAWDVYILDNSSNTYRIKDI